MKYNGDKYWKVLLDEITGFMTGLSGTLSAPRRFISKSMALATISRGLRSPLLSNLCMNLNLDGIKKHLRRAMLH
jgi:hypothetical protein